MKIKSQHIPFETLADLAHNQEAAEKRPESVSHLATCSSCAGELQRLEELLQLMMSDKEPDAPRDVIAYAMNLFGKGREATKPSRVRRLIAVLSFDSSMNLAPAFGVRSGQTASRQLVYSVEGKDIDLRVVAKEDQWLIAGQVLGQECIGGEVNLEGESGSASASISELCEFILPPVASGDYKLHVRFDRIELEISHLQIGA